ncbi:MAG: hypothetical protein ACPGC9_01295, partial [Cytophagales bacterium]
MGLFFVFVHRVEASSVNQDFNFRVKGFSVGTINTGVNFHDPFPLSKESYELSGVDNDDTSEHALASSTIANNYTLFSEARYYKITYNDAFHLINNGSVFWLIHKGNNLTFKSLDLNDTGYGRSLMPTHGIKPDYIQDATLTKDTRLTFTKLNNNQLKISWGTSH